MMPEQTRPPETTPDIPPYYTTPQANNQRAPVSPTDRVCQIIYLVFGIVEVLIAIRVILKLLAANPDAGFSSLIYGITQPLVAFFQGVFPTPTGSRGSVFELSSVLAIIVYALLAYVIVRVIRITSARRQTPGGAV